MKKVFALTMVLVICAGLLGALSGCDSSVVTIRVYNWGEYISTGAGKTVNVLKEFTAQTGIKVKYSTFDTNEGMYSKLKSGGATYDVIIPSDYMIARLIDEDMLEKIDFSNVPNFSYIDPQFVNPGYDPANEFSVPYTWGTVGLFYNKTMVDGTPDSWDILWDEKYSGQILMFDNPRDSFGIAQKLLGQSFNTTNEDEWRAAADKLIEQKPLVQAYVMDTIFNKMESGEAALAPYYAGDFAIMRDENGDIGFVFPKEGTNRFVDAMCIPKDAKHKAEAEMFINFMCSTEIALANVEATGYSTPQTQAWEQLPDDVKNDPVFYPGSDVLGNTEVFSALPSDIYDLSNKLWTELKIGK